MDGGRGAASASDRRVRADATRLSWARSIGLRQRQLRSRVFRSEGGRSNATRNRSCSTFLPRVALHHLGGALYGQRLEPVSAPPPLPGWREAPSEPEAHPDLAR